MIINVTATLTLTYDTEDGLVSSPQDAIDDLYEYLFDANPSEFEYFTDKDDTF